MKRYGLLLGVGCVLSLAFCPAALAAPVRAADFTGKKICWDNGSASSYGAGGKYSNNMTGEGTWAMAGSGVHIHTDRYDYVAKIQKMPDGTFHATVGAAATNGKYCN